MARKRAQVSDARKGKVVTPSKFKNYDHCLNTYVGCEFGCKYCYVRFFVKDKNHEWGEFVRVRKHVKDKLPKELPDLAGTRLVLGTMTDPYQPAERKHRITRKALELILNAKDPLGKVGIFTRSPIVLDDIDLIKQLPKARVHFTVTPFSKDILNKIEPIAVRTKRRWEVVEELKKAGIRVHVNVAPAIPIISESFTDEYADKLAALKVDEFFVDPMQAYSAAFDALEDAMAGHKDWPEIKRIMISPIEYGKWKNKFKDQWFAAWKKREKTSPDTLPIWSDHESKVWRDMRTDKQMSPRNYGDG